MSGFRTRRGAGGRDARGALLLRSKSTFGILTGSCGLGFSEDEALLLFDRTSLSLSGNESCALGGCIEAISCDFGTVVGLEGECGCVWCGAVIESSGPSHEPSPGNVSSIASGFSSDGLLSTALSLSVSLSVSPVAWYNKSSLPESS